MDPEGLSPGAGAGRNRLREARLRHAHAGYVRAFACLLLLLLGSSLGSPTLDLTPPACLSKPGAGQVLVKTLCISVDPYLRIKLYPKEDVSPEEEGGEFAPFKLHEPLSSMFVGEVVAAGEGVAAFKPGDRVSGVGPWARFAALDAAALQPVPSDVRACVRGACVRVCVGMVGRGRGCLT